jgi:dienelactone hydrolase
MAIVEQVMRYGAEEGLEGRLVFDDTAPRPRPGVLILHQFKGPQRHEREVAIKLARLGYCALVADIYGLAERPSGTREGVRQLQRYFSEPALTRERVRDALELMRAQSAVDQSRIAAIGYCFGGYCALELARSGAEVLGVVSVHGSLQTPLRARPGEVKARVLVLHGRFDMHAPIARLPALVREMRSAGARLDVVVYPWAAHAFTDEAAWAWPFSFYSRREDEDAWRRTLAFFKELGM